MTDICFSTLPMMPLFIDFIYIEKNPVTKFCYNTKAECMPLNEVDVSVNTMSG